MQFVVSDYLATGEGMTICILVTKAYPSQEDYEDSNSYTNPDGSFHWKPSKVKEGVTSETIALRQFKKEFGEFYSFGAEIFSKEKFVEKWGKWVPVGVLNIIEQGGMGNIYYTSKLHVNYA